MRFLPTRQKHESVKIIADLDRIIMEPVGFRFHGKEFVIQPVTNEKFFKVTKALSSVHSLLNAKAQGEAVEEEAISGAYFHFISSLCPEFRMKDLKEMEVPQLTSLINLILRHVTGGDLDPSSEKKKSLMTPTPQPSHALNSFQS